MITNCVVDGNAIQPLITWGKVNENYANQLANTPGGMQIRTLQTLEKISSDPSQKTVFVLPQDFKSLFK